METCDEWSGENWAGDIIYDRIYLAPSIFTKTADLQWDDDDDFFFGDLIVWDEFVMKLTAARDKEDIITLLAHVRADVHSTTEKCFSWKVKNVSDVWTVSVLLWAVVMLFLPRIQDVR